MIGATVEIIDILKKIGKKVIDPTKIGKLIQSINTEDECYNAAEQLAGDSSAAEKIFNILYKETVKENEYIKRDLAYA